MGSFMTEFDDLYYAIAQGEADVVNQLLSRNRGLVHGDEENPPPLHWAVFHDQIDVADLLLAKGASITQTDADRGATPLEYAAVYGRKEAIRLLLANGAKMGEAIAVARKGARGGFAEFEELPSATDYQKLLTYIEAEL